MYRIEKMGGGPSRSLEIGYGTGRGDQTRLV